MVINSQKGPRSLKELPEQHQEIFSVELGTIQLHQSRITIKEGAKPKFFRPRFASFAISEPSGHQTDLSQLK